MNFANRILSENPEGLATLAKRIRSSRRDGSLTPQALWRWATRGIKLPDGTIVCLETVRCAGRYLSSAAAIERFIAAQNPETEPASTPAVRTPTRRQRASAKAASQLADIGI